MLDTSIGDEAEKRRLLKFHSHALSQRPVKNRVAGGIGKIGKHHRVFFTEDWRTMQEKPERPGSDSKQENHRHRDPSPRFRLLDLYLHLGVARGNNSQFVLRHQVHVLSQTIPSAGHRNDVPVVLGALAQRLAQHKDVAAEIGLLHEGVGPH